MNSYKKETYFFIFIFSIIACVSCSSSKKKENLFNREPFTGNANLYEYATGESRGRK